MSELEVEAAAATTSPARLQELASSQPRLRPIIAMNPSAYPALIQWLETLNDPAVNVALAQRKAATHPGPVGPQRVSIMGRDPATYSSSIPSRVPTPSQVNEPRASGPRTDEIAVVTKSDTSSPHIRLLLGLVTLAGVMVLIVFLFLAGILPGGNTHKERPERTAGEEKVDSAITQEDEDEDEDDPEESVPVYPAPDTALGVNHFVSPSGNIVCRLDLDQTTCTINAHNFIDTNMATCGAGPLTLVATEDGASLVCSAEQVGATGATTLSYQDYAAVGDFACLSSEQGVSCWNIISGDGFAVAREGYLIGKSGPIQPDQLPWF